MHICISIHIYTSILEAMWEMRQIPWIESNTICRWEPEKSKFRNTRMHTYTTHRHTKHTHKNAHKCAPWANNNTQIHTYTNTHAHTYTCAHHTCTHTPVLPGKPALFGCHDDGSLKKESAAPREKAQCWMPALRMCATHNNTHVCHTQHHSLLLCNPGCLKHPPKKGGGITRKTHRHPRPHIQRLLCTHARHTHTLYL